MSQTVTTINAPDVKGREVTDIPDCADTCSTCGNYPSAVYVSCCAAGLCGNCYHDGHYLLCRKHLEHLTAENERMKKHIETLEYRLANPRLMR